MILLAVLLMMPFGFAAKISMFRVFSGKEHCRVFIRSDEEFGKVRFKSLKLDPPRHKILISGLKATEPQIIEVNQNGVQFLQLNNQPDGLHISIASDFPRTSVIHRLSKNVVVVDVVIDGNNLDSMLPSLLSLSTLNDEKSDISSQIIEVSSNDRKQSSPDSNKKQLSTDSRKDTTKENKERPKASATKERIVVIDAGHGGDDHGAIGYRGTREADIALQLSLRLQTLLKKRKNMKVVMTRTTDVFIELAERSAIANKHKADLFLSIHANAAPVDTMHGIETYTINTASDKAAEKLAKRENSLAVTIDGTKDVLLGSLVHEGTNRLSQQFALELQKNVVNDLRVLYGKDKIKDLGHKTALFYVLVKTKIPAVLFEASFLSNPGDERRLRSPYFQQRVVQSIDKSIHNYFQSISNESTVSEVISSP